MSEHAALFRQCLIDLDVAMMRQIWYHVAAHLPQPTTDDECLMTMHLARAEMTTLPEDLRRYSAAWLAERIAQRTVSGIGIAAMIQRDHTPGTRAAMVDATEQAIKAGLDPDQDAVEIKRRMMAARVKEFSALGRK